MRPMTFIFLATLAVTASPALAQDPPTAAGGEAVEEGEPICIGIGRRWLGTTADIKAIRSVPVPKSYADGYGEAPCWSGFTPDQLIGWHGRYGSEQSALAAVSYMEERRGKQFASVEADIATLKKELKRARKLGPRDETNREAYGRFSRIVQNPSNRLEEGIMFGNDIMFVAERFSSTGLRDRAAHWLREYDRLRLSLPPVLAGEKVSEADRVYRSERNEFSRTDAVAELLRLRIALLDAQRDRNKLPEYLALVERANRPEYKKLDHYVYHGDDFCDLPEYAPEAVQSACSVDSDTFRSRALSYFYFRAMARLLAGTRNDYSDVDFYTLYKRSRLDDGGRDRIWLAGDNREATLKRTEALTYYTTPQQGRREPLVQYDALQMLVDYADSINPVDDPMLFRQLANQALLWDAEIAALAAAKGEQAPSSSATKLDYYRLVLPHLNAVVSGEYKPQ